MVWFKVDDGFASSRKVLSIPKARRLPAVGVWLLAGAWAAGQLTDGFIPHYALDAIPGAKSYANDLVSAELWEQNAEGFQFHDWQSYQPARDDVLTERAINAARQKAYRDRKRAERDAARNAVTNGVTNGAPGKQPPDPTRPDPTRPDRSSFGTTKGVSAPRASARTHTRPKSTATKRAEDLAEIADEIEAERAANNGASKQIGP